MDKKNILLIGNGAREHIIAEKIVEDSNLISVMSKKNPAIAKLSYEYFLCDITNPTEVKSLVSGKKIDFAFVSPDPSLAAGVSDVLEELGISVASPSKDVADIECNKEFARNLMIDHNIPGSVKFKTVSNESEAISILREFNNEVAIKPIGLTGGKGVKVRGDHFNSESEAMAYINELLVKDGKLLIEEKLVGEEFTLQAFSDGSNLSFMPPVQDHKRAFENDKGPNTGGMGSYSTGDLLPFMESSDLEKAKITMKKTIEALGKERTKFKGVLYGQFMLTVEGPKIIEYNARFGDPEAMNVLSVLETPFSDIIESIADGNLGHVKFSNESTIVKYLVPEGYPINPKKDKQVVVDYDSIHKAGAKLYYSSVYEKGGVIYTTASRSFGVVAISKTISDAERIASNSIKFISGPLRYRKDIGTKELLEKRIKHIHELMLNK